MQWGRYKQSNSTQPKSIETLCNNIKKLSNSAVQQSVDDVIAQFTTVLHLFSKCHHGYNSSHFMNDEDIKELGKNNMYINVTKTSIECTFTEQNINNFMAFYRASFPEATVLPKMHILEDHVVPWFSRWHLGFGLMGEQGAESIHAHLMRMERTFQGIANEVDRYKYIFKLQLLESDPSLVALRPPPQKRPKRTSSED